MTESEPEFQIRLAVAGDATSIAAVLHQSFIEYQQSYTSEAFAATAPAVAKIKERLNEGPVWVAVCEGVIIGTNSVVSRGESLYIRGMAALPQARGQGVGQALLRRAEDFAIANGHKRLVLSTTPFLARAIRLYQQAGFRRTQDGPHDLHGTPLFTMEKML